MSYIKTFNNLVEQFLTELIEIFPENNSIKVRYTLFKTLVQVNVKKPCIDFMVRIIPYLEKIALKDYDSLFTGQDSPEIISKLQIDKQTILSLSDNNKAVLWKYIQSLILFGSKIVEMPEETHKLIKYIIAN